MHLRRNSQDNLPNLSPQPIKETTPVKKLTTASKPQYQTRSRDPLLKLIKSGNRRNWGSRWRAKQPTFYEENTQSINRREDVPDPQPQVAERMVMDSSEMLEIAKILEQ